MVCPKWNQFACGKSMEYNKERCNRKSNNGRCKQRRRFFFSFQVFVLVFIRISVHSFFFISRSQHFWIVFMLLKPDTEIMWFSLTKKLFWQRKKSDWNLRLSPNQNRCDWQEFWKSKELNAWEHSRKVIDKIRNIFHWNIHTFVLIFTC